MTPFPTEVRENIQFSGHETFPLRQLWLRKAHDAVVACPDLPSTKSVFSGDESIARFGVGKNMVGSIRHWGLACEVLRPISNGYSVGPLGKLLFGDQGVDPYLEHPATSWLVHWMLAGKALRSTTWFWLFNHVSGQTFDRDSVFQGLAELASGASYAVSESTLRRDVEVCLRCYVPRVGDGGVEDIAEPLLGELGIIYPATKSSFEFRRGPKPSLPDGVFAFALAAFWKRWESETQGSQATMSIEAITHDYCSPGRIFKLDENSVAERLLRMEDVTGGKFRWSESAGIRQVIKDSEALNDASQWKFAESAYA